tara:strand:+ start:466 stop:699 length:234 start_codon:yes stop_codon:yes gene_type:complete
MPTYDVKNLKTGEKQTLHMTMKEYCDWKEENPDWDKDWEAASPTGTIYGKPKQSDGFKEVMSKVQKAHPGANLSRFT